MPSTTIQQEREALAAVIANNIPGLNAYAYWVHSIQSPAALIRPQRRRRQSQGDINAIERMYAVTIVQMLGDAEDAQMEIDKYIEEDGNESVIHLIELNPTLGGVVDYAWVDSWQDYGGMRTEAGAFYGVSIMVGIYS